MNPPEGCVSPDWRTLYRNTTPPPRGVSVLERFIDARAEEFKFELTIMGERALLRIDRVAGWERRRKRLNPLNRLNVLI